MPKPEISRTPKEDIKCTDPKVQALFQKEVGTNYDINTYLGYIQEGITLCDSTLNTYFKTKLIGASLYVPQSKDIYADLNPNTLGIMGVNIISKKVYLRVYELIKSIQNDPDFLPNAPRILCSNGIHERIHEYQFLSPKKRLGIDTYIQPKPDLLNEIQSMLGYSYRSNAVENFIYRSRYWGNDFEYQARNLTYLILKKEYGKNSIWTEFLQNEKEMLETKEYRLRRKLFRESKPKKSLLHP